MISMVYPEIFSVGTGDWIPMGGSEPATWGEYTDLQHS